MTSDTSLTGVARGYLSVIWGIIVTHRGIFVLIALLTLLASPGADVAHAETTDARKRSAGDRLVMAGRQRMLAESLAAKLCLIESGIAVEESRQELYVLWNIFGWYHRGLVQGNLQLGLLTEQDGGVIATWRKADQVWQELYIIYEPVVNGKAAAPGDAGLVVSLTETMTDATSTVVAALRAAYADDLGPRGFGSALLLDLYERQRMLGQRIAKNVCLISSGDQTPERLEELKQAIDLFSTSLLAFQSGLADVGVPKPPTPEIAEGLVQVAAIWQPAEPMARLTAIGAPPEPAGLLAFKGAMDRVNASMTAVINDLVALKSQ